MHDTAVFAAAHMRLRPLRAKLSKGRRSRNKVSVGEPAEGSPFTIEYTDLSRHDSYTSTIL